MGLIYKICNYMVIYGYEGVGHMNDVAGYVSHLIERALEAGASDIHLEPAREGFLIRFRLDGFLKEVERKAEEWGPPIVSRIKLISGMDIGERRLPQDGGFTYENPNGEEEHPIDIRASTLPTIYGEKIVLRLLPHHVRFTSLASLGMENRHVQTVKRMLIQSQGMILISGPTGSGKTTTMYAMLQELKKDGRNVISLEQPVEYRVPGVNQVQIHPRSGLSFHEGLRAVLRQDPDVILVGEIRDRQTAEVAIRAALTGHLIISTIHTIDSVGTVIRLLDMGIEPYLVSSALTGVIAQRLIRKVCSYCYGQHTKCDKCQGSGLFGRIGIYEVLALSDDFHPLILNRCSAETMRRHLYAQEDFTSLFSTLQKKVAEGVAEAEAFERYAVLQGKDTLVR